MTLAATTVAARRKRRRRLRSIRERPLRPFDEWLAAERPATSSDEADAIRRTVELIAGIAGVAPTQLRLVDHVSGGVFAPSWIQAVGHERGLVELRYAIDKMLSEEYGYTADERWETVGDVIGFVLEHLYSGPTNAVRTADLNDVAPP